LDISWGKQEEIREDCMMWGLWQVAVRREMRTGFWWGNLKERDHLEDLDTHLLLLRSHYSPMWTFATSIDFSQSALSFDLFFQFSILHILISVH
jgi:hypothetical protein